MTDSKKESKQLIYQADNGAIELRADAGSETFWANLEQISTLFGRDKSVISRHIKNIFESGELDEKEVVAKNAITTKHGAIKGKTQTKEVGFYNLDVMISVGYRVNSKTATQFRQWATKTLKQHITDGYTINKTHINHNYELFMQSVEEVKRLNKNKELTSDNVLELVKLFGQTWFSLDAYDKGELIPKIKSKESLKIEADELYSDLAKFKSELMSKDQATDIFGTEKRQGELGGILGTVFQTAFGKDAYPSVESKAAHLMYFVVKNHPFNDGNKRSGAFCLIWFLNRCGVSFLHTITPQTLTSLTLLVATSDPGDKDRVVNLIMALISGGE